jgi:hypothetical protein
VGNRVGDFTSPWGENASVSGHRWMVQRVGQLVVDAHENGACVIEDSNG